LRRRVERREGYNYNWIVDELTKQEKASAVQVNMLLNEDERSNVDVNKLSNYVTSATEE
jgi:hypothetical protein